MKRIALVTALFPMRAQPWRGRPLYQTALALRKYADVECFCPVAVYPDLPGVRPVTFEAVRPDPIYQPDGIRTHYFEYPTFPRLGRITNGWFVAKRIHKSMAAFRPDVILAYWLYPDAYGALQVSRKLGVPLIAGSRGSDLNRLTDPWTQRFTRQVLTQSRFVLTVSEELRRKAIELGAPASQVRLITNGCDTQIFHPADRLDARRLLQLDATSRLILYVGNLLTTKGLLELWSAFSQLAAAHADLRLALVGQGSAREQIETMARETRLQNHLLFPGPANPQQVARWMAACDIFCLPSHAEGCPNVVLEALACGRPVVGTTVGAIPDLVTPECGLLVPAHDAPALASALTQALATRWDSAKIAQLRQRSWEDVGLETFEAIQHCLAIR